MKTLVYWKNTKKRIEVCQRIGLHECMNVNRESEYEVDDTKMKEIQELEKEGLIQLRKK